MLLETHRKQKGPRSMSSKKLGRNSRVDRSCLPDVAEMAIYNYECFLNSYLRFIRKGPDEEYNRFTMIEVSFPSHILRYTFQNVKNILRNRK